VTFGPIRAITIVAVIVAGCSPTIVPSATPAAVDVTGSTASPEAATPEGPADWTLVHLSAPGVLGVPEAMAVVGDEIVGIGVVTGTAEKPVEILEAWTSHDGVTWARKRFGRRTSSATWVTAWGDRALAVGAGAAPQCRIGEAVAIWIRSADGTWPEAPFNPLFCGATDTSAAASRGTAVIVGTAEDGQPFAWFSADGFRWTNRPGLFPSETATRTRISTLPDGAFVASGTDLGRDRAWVSRSADGIVWEQPRPLAVEPGGVVLAHVERVGGVTLLVGLSDDRAMVMTSADGTNWQSAAVDGLTIPDVQSIRAYAGGLIAIGTGELTSVVAVSADGRHWRRVAVPPDIPPDGLVGGGLLGGRAVLVGRIDVEGNPIPAAWYGPASLLAP
jgi:hypothetical protein